METSAVRVRTQATLLATTAAGISGAGRLQDVATLRSDADELVRLAETLARWAARETGTDAAPSSSPLPPGEGSPKGG